MLCISHMLFTYSDCSAHVQTSGLRLRCTPFLSSGYILQANLPKLKFNCHARENPKLVESEESCDILFSSVKHSFENVALQEIAKARSSRVLLFDEMNGTVAKLPK